MNVRVRYDGARTGRPARMAGALTLATSLFALVIGLVLVESLFTDLTASFRVSESAIVAIGETLDVVDDSVSRIGESLDAASASLASVGTAAAIASDGLEDVAVFLEEELPADLETILVAMPAAIQTAEAIDSTLSALAFFGVDYNPEEPFGDSLRRVEEALAELPDELRAQSATIQALIPSVRELGRQADSLAETVDAMETDLTEIHQLVGSYRITVDEAQASIEETNSNLGEKVWLLRLLIVLISLVGIVVGSALVSLGRTLDDLVVLAPEPDPALPRRSTTP